MFFSLRDYGKNMEGIVHNRNDAIVSEAALRFLKDELVIALIKSAEKRA